MGQTLSEPIRDKHTTAGASARFVWAASGMQGWRISMEDAHTTETNINPKGTPEFGFFAVFDGHGGHTAAQYAGRHLHGRVANEPAFAAADYPMALKRGFLDLDQDLREDKDFNGDPAGCTAVAALVTDKAIYVANAGDSRAVLGVAGQTKALSDDHKPNNPSEQARIDAAGGFVEFGRVNGNLALSRALGDFEFKQGDFEPEYQIVTANPDISEHTISEDDEFLALGCDGIFDVMTNDDLIAYIRYHIVHGKDLGWICEDVMERCLAPDAELGGVGCDNMTVMVVALLGGRTEPEWREWMRTKYAQSKELHPTQVSFARRIVTLTPSGNVEPPIGAAGAAASDAAAAEALGPGQQPGSFN
ncbi:phosphatase 2C-like domain-containing protein [Blastocladiella britannica]|nr:phosphatase 2C-like domain-containing protein [Blastocladiella britannica]